jgi:hypothetical protein
MAGCALAAWLALPSWAAASSDDAGSATAGDEKRTDAAAEPAGDSLYRPPSRGKPRGRVGGGVRGVRGSRPALYSLVPEHTGQTVSEQPSLFWYLEGPPPGDAALFFTLIDETSIDPLLEVELPRPAHPGIQRVDLSRYEVRLERGTEYEWSVALVVDPEQRANDIVAAGWIDRVDTPEGLGEGGAPTARTFARHGLWYDALAAAADGVEAEPGAPAPRALRDALLREVGLDLAASTRSE